MFFIYLQPLSNPIELINDSSIISFVALCIMLVYKWYLLLNHKEIVVSLPFQMTSFGGLKLRASRCFCFPPLHGLMRKDLKNGHFPVEEY